ncbi:RNA polymerase subunit sigma-70 [Xenorhabdus budapestensis]|uniref:RNA polymerase subunit sigma-70 n=1 Tax=Xenorhabdus budapestensis TaxID=290110 RepID=A0ABX7VG44_XENBU|nr:RNA polymerase subunit sigma-70 [Xenorhabdus budapestensis]QTL38792.1 RNA polymerase subunit sigma-70 [Xenorhabdus budapestensis]QTL41008.1 RNA polymerase subunit sigma-70 [Xenorhabdus budapestensis]
MNQSEFAKLHGVSRKTVTQWKARGWLVMAGDDINVEASNANIERYRKTVTRSEKKPKGNKQGNSQGNKPGNTLGNTPKPDTPAQVVERILTERGATMSLDEAKTMKENYLALLTQHEYDLKSGKVLPWQDMIDAVRQEYSRMRTRLIAIAPEHGPRLRAMAGTDTDTEFVVALQEIIYEAMEELSLDHSEQGG